MLTILATKWSIILVVGLSMECLLLVLFLFDFALEDCSSSFDALSVQIYHKILRPKPRKPVIRLGSQTNLRF